MKKIILAIITVSLGLFSCEDFIEHDERGNNLKRLETRRDSRTGKK